MTRDGARNVPCHAPRLKLRARAGRSLSVFPSLSIQAVAYLPVEYSSGARNGDRYGKEAEMRNELGCVSCSVLPFCFSDRPPKIFLPRRFYPEGTSLLSFVAQPDRENPLF